jgi:hypothetical protein
MPAYFHVSLFHRALIGSANLTCFNQVSLLSSQDPYYALVRGSYSRFGRIELQTCIIYATLRIREFLESNRPQNILVKPP